MAREDDFDFRGRRLRPADMRKVGRTGVLRYATCWTLPDGRLAAACRGAEGYVLADDGSFDVSQPVEVPPELRGLER